jgi:hypothetical protein
MGRIMGFEPTASGATIQRSNLLSYIRHRNLAFAKLLWIIPDKAQHVICYFVTSRILFPGSFDICAKGVEAVCNVLVATINAVDITQD